MRVGEIVITPFFRWFDLWVGVYVSWPDRYVRGLRIYICPLPAVGIKIDLSETKLWINHAYGYQINHAYGYYDDELSEHWLCNCGQYIEDGLHCPNCRAEPPWGCPCSWCQDERYYEEEELDANLYHPGPWDN